MVADKLRTLEQHIEDYADGVLSDARIEQLMDADDHSSILAETMRHFRQLRWRRFADRMPKEEGIIFTYGDLEAWHWWALEGNWLPSGNGAPFTTEELSKRCTHWLVLSLPDGVNAKCRKELEDALEALEEWSNGDD